MLGYSRGSRRIFSLSSKKATFFDCSNIVDVDVAPKVGFDVYFIWSYNMHAVFSSFADPEVRHEQGAE